jgi:hypothetical protein
MMVMGKVARRWSTEFSEIARTFPVIRGLYLLLHQRQTCGDPGLANNGVPAGLSPVYERCARHRGASGIQKLPLGLRQTEGFRLWRGLGLKLDFRLADMDRPFEEGAVFNAYAVSEHIAGD